MQAASDYSRAIAQFVDESVHALMAAMDTTYAALQRESLPEGVKSTSVDTNGASTASPMVAMNEEFSIDKNIIRNGELDAFHQAISKIATSFLEQFMAPFFEYVGEAAGAVGNNLTFEGSTLTWADIVDSYEKVEWQADDLGIVHKPRMLVGAKVKEILAALGDEPVDQQVRLALIAHRKQEEFVSRRRSRRLR